MFSAGERNLALTLQKVSESFYFIGIMILLLGSKAMPFYKSSSVGRMNFKGVSGNPPSQHNHQRL